MSEAEGVYVAEPQLEPAPEPDQAQAPDLVARPVSRARVKSLTGDLIVTRTATGARLCPVSALPGSEAVCTEAAGSDFDALLGVLKDAGFEVAEEEWLEEA